MNLIGNDRVSLGVCYYPEHWQEADWENDLQRMLASGIETVRIAEFAWNLIEPREGSFDYAFFDRFLDVAEKTGMQVVFCTPTATPPAWLTKKYPEVLNATMEGVVYQHGFRRHYNYNSPKYQELCRRIVGRIAAHYASRPCIVGWQIDNEFNCETAEFYSESDSSAFRNFLKRKYRTLDALNAAWGTVFWNQTYTAWEEVDVPRATPTGRVNPHRRLDFYRFISDSVCRFAKMQSDILRRYVKKGDFITTNGIFGNLDSHRMTEESLDLMMYDSYPNFSYCPALYHEEDPTKDRNWSRHLSEVRSISPHFGVMEQQSGANGSMEMMAPVPKPGQITLWTMQSIAHGADFVSFFRWRTATMGTEMYWHGILDYSGRENRRLAEVRDISQKLKKMEGIAGSSYEAQVAVVRDYDNIWNGQADVWQRDLEQASIWGLFQACQHTHTPFDYVYIDHCSKKTLDQYKVVFCPHLAILTQEQADILRHYAEQGGKDCLAVWNWLYENAAEKLGGDPERMGLYGTSAGGCLCAGMAFYIRDHGGPEIKLNVLNTPVLGLEPLLSAEQMRYDAPIVSGHKLADKVRLYCRDLNGQLPSYYAVPNVALDYSELPPTMVIAAEYDPLRGQSMQYVQNLQKDAIPVEFYLMPRCIHGFNAKACDVTEWIGQGVVMSFRREFGISVN